MKRKVFLPLIVVFLISSFAFLFVCCNPKGQVEGPPIENQTPLPPVLGHTIIQAITVGNFVSLELAVEGGSNDHATLNALNSVLERASASDHGS
jgi:hypothetical protein